jgi:hypothetical protein
VSLEKSHLVGQLVGKEQVIVVEKGKVNTSRRLNTSVARSAAPGIRLVEMTHSRVTDTAHNRCRSIGRTVIHDDDLKVAIRLCPDAVDCLPDIVTPIVGRHDNTDQRFVI